MINNVVYCYIVLNVLRLTSECNVARLTPERSYVFDQPCRFRVYVCVCVCVCARACALCACTIVR